MAYGQIDPSLLQSRQSEQTAGMIVAWQLREARVKLNRVIEDAVNGGTRINPKGERA